MELLRALALLLLLLCMRTRCATCAVGTPTLNQPDTPGLLLVVGSVSSTHARVLFDRPNGAIVTTLHVRVFTTPSAERSHSAVFELKREFSVSGRASGAPDVLVLDDLEPNHVYAVGLRADAADEEEIVKLRTPQTPSSGTRAAADRILVVSCDRYVDDHDDTLWLQIVDDIESHPDSYFGMAHIGDQVYVDAGAASIPIERVPEELMTGDPTLLRQRFDTLVDQFRSIYRLTFGRPIVQRALRNGAHWMIPDDHEIINNLNYERVQRVFRSMETASSQVSEQEQEELWGLALHYRAGLQVYYEFQYQLRGDFPFDSIDFLFEPLDEIVARFPAHFVVEVYQLKLFFMDLRLDRAFFRKSGESEMLPQLIGKAQMKQLETQLEQWSADQQNAVVVLSSVPLFFHSALTGAITYMVEKETYPGMQAQLPGLHALFRLFTRYSDDGDSTWPSLKLLVGGDVHFLAHSHVCDRTAAASKRCIDQLITSGITKGSTAITDPKLVPFYFLIARFTPFVSKLLTLFGLSQLVGLPPWDIQYDKLFLGRNFGVIELSPNGTFEWEASVIAAHEEGFQDGLQWIMEVSLVRIAGAVAFVVATHRILFR